VKEGESSAGTSEKTMLKLESKQEKVTQHERVVPVGHGHQTQPYASDSAMEPPVSLADSEGESQPAHLLRFGAAIPDALAPTEQSQSQLPITDMNLHLACQQQAGPGFIPLELPSHQAQVLQQEAALQEAVHFITPNILCVPEPHAELILQALDIHIPVAQQRQSVWAHHI